MPYQPHIAVRVEGTLGIDPAVEETFTFGFALGLPFAPGEAISGTLLLPDTVSRLAIDQAIRNWFDDPVVGISTAAVHRSTLFASKGPDGRVIVEANGTFRQVRVQPPAGTTGGGGANIHPYQVAHVVTLETPLPGPTGRGRMYLPLPTWDVQNDGVISAATAQGIADRTVVMFEQVINAVRTSPAPLDIADVIVPSSKGHSGSVNEIRVGVALDTLRSRRRDLEENHVSSFIEIA